MLVVADEREEARVLASLTAFEDSLGVTVLPVLDRSGLVARLTASLQQSGILVRIERASSHAVREDMRPAARPRNGSRPEAVLIAGSVDPACQLLAAHLCDTVPVPLSAALVSCDWKSGRSSALVLLEPGTAKLEKVLPVLSALMNRVQLLGFIYALEPIETRFAILKTLAVDRLSGPEDMFLLSMQDSQDDAAGRPTCFSDPSGPEGTVRLRQPCDVLVVSGHANPFDAMFGRDKALCARADAAEEPAKNLVFPCFGSGDCFRQPRMQRAARDAQGLMSLRDVKARIVVLAGCHTAALGDSWFDPSATLAYRCQQSAAAAALATSGLSIERMELNFLLMALLSEGRCLGEAARELNRVRREFHGHATSLPDHLGPFLVLGNPGVRFAGNHPVRSEARWTSGKSFEIELDGIETNPGRGALVRVEIPMTESACLLLRSAPEGLWCRGVLHPHGESGTLYLWLGVRSDQEPVLSGSLMIETDEVPSSPTSGSLQSYLRQIPFWMVALDSFRADSEDAPECAAKLAATLQLLPAVARSLSVIANAIRFRPGILVVWQRIRVLDDAGLAQASALAQILLDCLVEISSRFGTMHSGAWENSFERVNVTGPLDVCTCGSAPLWGQLSQFVGIDSLKRAEYQCARCGPVGEDDGRRLLRVSFAPTWVRQGGSLRCRCACHAPAGERVQFRVVLLLEGLYEGGRIAGRALHATVEPTCSVDLEVEVEVPGSMRPGIYPFAVLGIVSGASCIIRQMIEVRGGAG